MARNITKVIGIEELVQDSKNFNKGTDEGQRLMERSFKELGAGRSILIDKDGNIIAGNKSQKAAIAAGIQKVRVIETTGDELVAVKRTDLSLDSKEGRELALADNLTTQVNLSWDEIQLQEVDVELQGFDLSDWGAENLVPTGETEEAVTSNINLENQVEDDDDVEYEKEIFARSMMGDFIYDSNNAFEIPNLLLEQQPVHLELPITPWGANSRLKTDITTYHFYVDDYRFEALFKDPTKLVMSGCRAIVEPNCSIHDQLPIPIGIYRIYRKRYLARYLQECGVKVWVDLNVAHKFAEYNQMGIPKGYNAFFTRGMAGWLNSLYEEFAVAQEISGKEIPNMVVYGGGKEVKEFCQEHSLVFITDFMTLKHENMKSKL